MRFSFTIHSFHLYIQSRPIHVDVYDNVAVHSNLQHIRTPIVIYNSIVAWIVVSTSSFNMDHKKSTKNDRPTVKLSDLSLTPVYIALLVVFISIGKFDL